MNLVRYDGVRHGLRVPRHRSPLDFVLGWNLRGDAFRDILAPRLRGSS